VSYDYNFYHANYENKAAPTDVEEYALPNMYYLVLEHSDNKEFLNEAVIRHNTIKDGKRGFIPAFGVTPSIRELIAEDIKRKERRKIEDFLDVASFRGKDPIGKTVIMPAAFHRFMDENNNHKHVFPIVSDVRFNTDPVNNVSGMLEETKLDVSFSRIVLKDKNRTDDRLYRKFSTEATTENVFKAESEKLATFDLLDWWKVFIADISAEPAQELILASPENVSMKIATDRSYNFLRDVMGRIFEAKLKKFTNPLLRTFDHLLDGRKCYSEAVYYEILKMDENEQILQRTLVPNTEGSTDVWLVDTQLKYDKRYTYDVRAHFLVAASRYRYTNIQVDGLVVTANAFVEPELLLTRVPYYSERIRTLDKPPVPPDMEVVPYLGHDDQFLVRIMNNSGKYDLLPVAIDDDYQLDVRKFREAQKRQGSLGNKLTFESDEQAKLYRIYRLTEEPKSYGDFREASIFELTWPISCNINFVQPNTKYWFTVISVDNHGHRSNPSPVFQVELINNDGAVYLETRVIEMDVPEPKIMTREFKKYLHILPQFLQVAINTERSDFEDEKTARGKTPVLGLKEEASVFEKKFKVRVTSKHTGKAFDLNINFDLKHLLEEI